MSIFHHDPGDENDHGQFHPKDGWAREGCTCADCVELRSRPVGHYQLPDEAALQAGLHAMGYYIKQQEIDGDPALIATWNYFDQRGITLLRSKRLRLAVESEFRSQKVIGSNGEPQ